MGKRKEKRKGNGREVDNGEGQKSENIGLTGKERNGMDREID